MMNQILMKVLSLLLLVSFNLHAGVDYKNYTLDSFVSEVANANSINIFIDEDLSKENISFYIPTLKNPKQLLEAFKISISKKGLNLKKTGNFYYLSKKLKYKLNKYVFKLTHNCSNDFSLYLKTFDYKYVYLKDSNSFIVSLNIIQKKEVEIFLRTIDIGASQVMLKFVLLSFDNTKEEERGIKFSTLYQDASGGIIQAMNTIVLPLSSTSSAVLESTSFFAALRLLDTDGFLEVEQYPYMLIKNNNKFKFESVKNIPYLVRNTETDSNVVQENNSFEYKDVGLKINGSTSIYDDFITLNLDLTIENILNLDGDALTPTTSKSFLNSVTDLKYGQVLLLSGIEKTDIEKTNVRIPFFCNIPYVGKIFTYKYETDKKSRLTIAIEVIRSEDVDNNISDDKDLDEIVVQEEDSSVGGLVVEEISDDDI